MMTLTQVREQLAAWEAAYLAVSQGQSFSLNGRTLTRVDADMVWRQMQRLYRLEARLQVQQAGGSGRAALATFED